MTRTACGPMPILNANSESILVPPTPTPTLLDFECGPSDVETSNADPASLSGLGCRSTELFAALNALRADPALKRAILDVRGKGLMVAVEFASPTGTGAYDRFTDAGVPAKLASRVAAKCVEKGMLILTTSVYEVVRFIPPLNISKEDLAKGVQIFEEAVREVVKEAKA